MSASRGEVGLKPSSGKLVSDACAGAKARCAALIELELRVAAGGPAGLGKHFLTGREEISRAGSDCTCSKTSMNNTSQCSKALLSTC
jgi:hypothetical protein